MWTNGSKAIVCHPLNSLSCVSLFVTLLSRCVNKQRRITGYFVIFCPEDKNFTPRFAAYACLLLIFLADRQKGRRLKMTRGKRWCWVRPAVTLLRIDHPLFLIQRVFSRFCRKFMLICVDRRAKRCMVDGQATSWKR